VPAENARRVLRSVCATRGYAATMWYVKVSGIIMTSMDLVAGSAAHVRL
jgi:hypothetical protein